MSPLSFKHGLISPYNYWCFPGFSLLDQFGPIGSVLIMSSEHTLSKILLSRCLLRAEDSLHLLLTVCFILEGRKTQSSFYNWRNHRNNLVLCFYIDNILLLCLEVDIKQLSIKLIKAKNMGVCTMTILLLT